MYNGVRLIRNATRLIERRDTRLYPSMRAAYARNITDGWSRLCFLPTCFWTFQVVVVCNMLTTRVFTGLYELQLTGALAHGRARIDYRR